MDSDVVMGVRTIGSGDLQPVVTLRTGDEYGLSVMEMVKALEEMNAAYRNALPGTAVVTGVSDFGKQPA